MKRISNRELAHLNSLDELKRAQRKVNRQIVAMEDGFIAQVEEAKEMFSFRGIVAYVLDKVDMIQSLIRYASRGYGLISGLVKRRRY